LKVAELQIALKADKKAVMASANLQKKIHKKELKVETYVGLAKVKSQVNLTRDVECQKKILQKKHDSQVKTIQFPQKAFSDSKRQSSELVSNIMAMSKSKDVFKDEIKVLNNKTIKTLKSKVDNEELEQKNAHELGMQRIKNDYKQLGLDELRERLVNKKAGGVSNGPMSLEMKKDFVTHLTLLLPLPPLLEWATG
jgi:hypothetical protein